MISQFYGEIFALLTSLCWAISALSFEIAGKKIGSLPMNFIRMSLALIFISIYSLIFKGEIFPSGVNSQQLVWLISSGIVGFVLGDMLLFQSFVLIGARLGTLMMTMVAPITAIISWIAIKEEMSLWQIFAMLVTISGIFLVIYSRNKINGKNKAVNYKTSTLLLGFFLAFGGAAGQAGGLVLSKKGLINFDAFSASHIRIISGFVGYLIIISFAGLWKKVFQGIKNKPAFKAVSFGSLLGPFIGMSFSLIAVKHTSTGVAATLTSLAPVFIIVPAIFINKEKVSFLEVLGATFAVVGVALFFI